MEESDTEIVLMAENGGMEVDLLVGSVDEAVRDFEKAGGKIAQGRLTFLSVDALW